MVFNYRIKLGTINGSLFLLIENFVEILQNYGIMRALIFWLGRRVRIIL